MARRGTYAAQQRAKAPPRIGVTEGVRGAACLPGRGAVVVVPPSGLAATGAMDRRRARSVQADSRGNSESSSAVGRTDAESDDGRTHDARRDDCDPTIVPHRLLSFQFQPVTIADVLCKEGTSVKNVRELVLRGNGMQVLPACLTGFCNLVTLSVTWNQLSALPPAVCKLSHLCMLDASFNRIVHVPGDLANLHRLGQFELSDNCLSRLPAAFDQRLSSLCRLGLQYNQLENLPPRLRLISSLTALDVRGNELLPSQAQEASPDASKVLKALTGAGRAPQPISPPPGEGQVAEVQHRPAGSTGEAGSGAVARMGSFPREPPPADQAPGQAGLSSGQVKEEEIMEHEAAEDDEVQLVRALLSRRSPSSSCADGLVAAFDRVAHSL